MAGLSKRETESYVPIIASLPSSTIAYIVVSAPRFCKMGNPSCCVRVSEKARSKPGKAAAWKSPRCCRYTDMRDADELTECITHLFDDYSA